MPDAGNQHRVLIRAHRQHAALAQGGHSLGPVEAEAAVITKGAHVLTVDAGIQRLCAVLHHLQAVLPGDIQDGRHIAGHPQQVDADHSLGFWGNLAADVLRVDGPGVGVNVAPDDLRAGLAKGDGSGAESISGNNDLIAGLDTAQSCGKAQRVGGIVHGKSVLRANKRSKILLEFGQAAALGLPVHVAHDVDNGGNFLLGVGMLAGGDGHAVAGHGAPSGGVAFHNLRHILFLLQK